MQLEQTLEMYNPPSRNVETSARRNRTFVRIDLDHLSATVLYTGELQNGASAWRDNPPLGGGFSSGSYGSGSPFASPFKSIFNTMEEEAEKYAKYKPFVPFVPFEPSPVMGSSRPLDGSGRPLKEGYVPMTIRPFTGFELHIKEQSGGIAHIKYDKGKGYTEINSYDAAMADLLADQMDIKKILARCRLKLNE